MHLSVELRYAAPVAEVAGMLADETFVRWRAARVGGPEGQVQQVVVTGSEAGPFTVVVRRTLPSDVPAHVRGVVGGALELRHTEAWEAERDGYRVGTMNLEITGAPVRLTGTAILRPDGEGGTIQAYDGDIKATVPLFGGAIEEAAAEAVRSTLRAEEAAGAEWLASH